MPDYFANDREQLRAEIAATAARMIAEDGADYASAKRKAAQLILGKDHFGAGVLPDNAQVEEEVRIYNALYLSDTQPQRLQDLRQLALTLMQDLQAFSPYLTGAVLNGTASAHSDIYLHLFPDNPKEVSYFLLNKNISFETSETPHFRYKNEMVETLSFLVTRKNLPPEGVHLVVYNADDLRSKGRERASIAEVTTLLEKESPT